VYDLGLVPFLDCVWFLICYINFGTFIFPLYPAVLEIVYVYLGGAFRFFTGICMLVCSVIFCDSLDIRVLCW
jgi:hypothetical protein